MNKPLYMQDVELLLDVRKLNKHATVNDPSNLASMAMLHASSVLNKPGTCPVEEEAIAYINANVETDCSAYKPMAKLAMPYEIALALGVMHSVGDRVCIAKLTFDVDDFLRAEVFAGHFCKDEVLSIYDYGAGINENIYSDWIYEKLIDDMYLLMRLVALSERVQKLCYNEIVSAATLRVLHRDAVMRFHQSGSKEVPPNSNLDKFKFVQEPCKRAMSARAITTILFGPLSKFFHSYFVIDDHTTKHNRAAEKQETLTICGFEGNRSAAMAFVISALVHARYIKTLPAEEQTKHRNDIYATIGWLLYRLYDHSLGDVGTGQVSMKESQQ